MSVYSEIFRGLEIPRFARVSYALPSAHLADPAEETRRNIEKSGLLSRIHPEESVCIGVGSREIGNLQSIVRALVESLRPTGAKIFIVPAMGSHGGATPEGQREILAGYGITQEALGVPIRATMDTVLVGRTPSGLDVRMDAYAAGADHIIPVGRIKAHTDFRGPVESGLMKMLAIGLGKQYGASICHKMGFPSMSKNVMEFGQVMIQNRPVLFGLGILENAHHQTAKIAVIPAERIAEEEPPLLLEAKALMARLPFQKADVLLMDEIGKNISGAGMDPNVTGRSTMLGRSAPDFDQIVVFDLTDVSHGNGTGLGNADISTKRVFEKFRFEMTYPNCFTCKDGLGVKLPIIMPSDAQAILAALKLLPVPPAERAPRIVWLKNTLCLESFLISEALLPEADAIPGMTVSTPLQPVPLDKNGNIDRTRLL